MFNVVDELLGVLDLERLEVNLFRGGSPRVNWTRVFGGQVVAQALVAACRTVEGRPPHSLHGYFLLGGDPKLPILYEVDRIRDGKTFATRRVNAIQQGRAIFSMAASFVVDEPGPDYQVAMPHVPPPEDLPNDAQVRQQLLARIPEQVRDYFLRERAIELHPVEYERYLGKKYPDGVHMWMRTKSPVPDDPILHQCILAYASDMTLLDAAMVPLGRTVFEEDFFSVSLDHALWFHRPFRADEWLLYAQDGPSLHDSRGMSRGLIFQRDGALVASVAQEGLIRKKRPRR